MSLTYPGKNCPHCPRLVEFRLKNRNTYPKYHNAPVNSFGPINAGLLVVGLAPGLKGANRTARPFTGDYAGDLLFPTLSKFGFTSGAYGSRSDDGLKLHNCRITNAVRCVPPENKPIGAEINACRPFLLEEITSMPQLRIILALGTIAHASVIRTLGHKQSDTKFCHAAEYQLSDGPLLIDSYHCSRYNTNTRRLTTEMFHHIFRRIRQQLS